MNIPYEFVKSEGTLKLCLAIKSSSPDDHKVQPIQVLRGIDDM
jgi:hypothetical protein